MPQRKSGYPVQFGIDYPAKSDRLTVFLRLFLSIPIMIISRSLLLSISYMTAGFIVLPTLLMIVFRQKYPRWWFDWNNELLKFSNRVGAYLLLLTDKYPSTTDEQSVHLRMPYPNAKKDLNRWMPLVKWLLAIPHFVLLLFLGIIAGLATIISWFAILITGRYPKELFWFVVGVVRWENRVAAYAILLTTDKYPPFSLS